MNDNRCVCCGRIIPEGRQVCPICEKKSYKAESFDYWWNEWILQLGLVGFIIAVGIYLFNL